MLLRCRFNPIPGLAQWVKDPALLQLWHRSKLQQIQSLAQELPYDVGTDKKKKKRKEKTKHTKEKKKKQQREAHAVTDVGTAGQPERHCRTESNSPFPWTPGTQQSSPDPTEGWTPGEVTPLAECPAPPWGRSAGRCRDA